jgi:hypothetical protein
MSGTYGVLAQFRAPEELVDAARKARSRGYRKLDAYSPFPVEGLAEALEFRENRVPAAVLLGGVLGAAGGYVLQFGLSAVDYPLNVGGRPPNSIPAWIPIMFELTILCAALAAILGMLALNGLPMPYHPVFNVPEFARASADRFFLAIEAEDPLARREDPRDFLESLQPERTWLVDR